MAMVVIGLFKCNFCTTRLQDIESLITHFSVRHLNHELFECDSCNLKLWKISDFYEHKNKSSSTCGSQYGGINMKSVFTALKDCFGSAKSNENSPAQASPGEESDNSVKTEIKDPEILNHLPLNQIPTAQDNAELPQVGGQVVEKCPNNKFEAENSPPTDIADSCSISLPSIADESKNDSIRVLRSAKQNLKRSNATDETLGDIKMTDDKKRRKRVKESCNATDETPNDIKMTDDKIKRKPRKKSCNATDETPNDIKMTDDKIKRKPRKKSFNATDETQSVTYIKMTDDKKRRKQVKESSNATDEILSDIDITDDTPALEECDKKEEDNIEIKKCKLSDKDSVDRVSVQNHVDVVHGKTTYKCHICAKQFHIFKHLMVHNMAKHPENLFCIKCNKLYDTCENFQTHIDELHKMKAKGSRDRKPKGTKHFECFECFGKKIFTRVSTFVMHLGNKHAKSDDEIRQILEANNETFQNELMCKICGKLFATVDHIYKHQKKKHGDDGSKKHKCKSCPKFFATNDEVDAHTLQFHREQLLCQICDNGKYYSRIESLTFHMRKFHNNSSGGGAQNSDDVSEARKKSTKVYKFICGQCGKIMHGRTQFKNHEASNCGKNPVHKCHICDKGFASAGTLKGHISIHEDYESYPYVCDFCKKRYRSKHQLGKHRRIHTGERPFQCPHCDKAFGTSSALFVHVSTHTGVKRYMCTCGERFSCITGLKGHWKTNSATCGSDPNRSTKPVGEYIGYRKGKIVNIRPEDELMMRPSSN